MRFEKWTALGNDYLIVEAAALPWEPTPERVRRLCDPHFGVGSDGSCCLRPVEDPAYVAELRIFNPDGSEAELSGNGAREAVLYLRRSGWTDADEFTILTKAGPITPTIRSEREVHAGDGARQHDLRRLPLRHRGRARRARGRRATWRFQHVSIGNPQCAIDVGDELESLDLAAIGPEIESSTAVSEPHERQLLPHRRRAGSALGSSSAGWGRRSPRAPGHRGRPWRRTWRGAEQLVTVELDGGELEVEVGEELDGAADRLGRAGLRGRALAASCCGRSRGSA